MKIYISQKARENTCGGGWTFTKNFIKALKDKIEFVDKLEECDILFIPGPTLEERKTLETAKSLGKKIVFRIDNLPRNSKNRNTGTSRLYDFSQLADVIVYQSEWARKTIMPFVKKDGVVILNGADDSIFKKNGNVIKKNGSPQYLYIRSSRDELKRWEKAWYDFMEIYFQNPGVHLWIAGNFSSENVEYNFDLYGGAERRYKYWGMIEDRGFLATLFRSADTLLLPYYHDCCSNIAIEARQCGIKIVYDEQEGGGTKEIMKADIEELTLRGIGEKYLLVFQKLYA